MDFDAAVSLIRASDLADRLERILPHLAPSVRIRATRDASCSRALVSRFAGHGVLRRGDPWPTWDSSALHTRWLSAARESAKRPRSGKFWEREITRYEELVRANPNPIHFLAMIRLSDIAPHGSRIGLPDTGAVLFFYDAERMKGSFWPEARGGWRMLFVEDERDLVVHEPPVQLDDSVSSTLTFERQYSLPRDIRAETGDDDLGAYDNEFARIHQSLLGGDESQPVHHLGGAPQEVQHGLMHECQLASNGADCGSPGDSDAPRARALAPGAAEWRLVLQLDSDEAGPGWMWGDVCRLYFCLHQDDLRTRRFDRSWCVEQSC